MEKLIDVASYIYNRYHQTTGEKIDEMKLHKLLYFSQRESLIQNDEPMFPEVFYAWKYGPVLNEIRVMYRNGTFSSSVDESACKRIGKIMDSVVERYADKDSWSLSRLTRGEVSWKKSRIGIPDNENGDSVMNNEDIRADAERIRVRRKCLAQLASK